MLIGIANREDPDQTASSRLLLKIQTDLGPHCLSWPLFKATSVGNFRTSTHKCVMQYSIFILCLNFDLGIYLEFIQTK